MTGRERVAAIINGAPVDRCGYWTGSPHGDAWPICFKHFGCTTPEEFYCKLGDDVRRVAKILGPLVISPSHEAILPNVPPENVAAMAKAVKDLSA